LSEDVFTYLFRTYQREIDAYFLKKTRNRALAEDLTQDTFARVARMGVSIDNVDQKRPYLYRIAHNLLVDHLRREARQSDHDTHPGTLAALPDNALTPEEYLSSAQQSMMMREALLRLPSRTRQVFVLTRIDGLSYRDTAAALSISESSVQKHLATATAHLMRQLKTGAIRR
jgi:RNA polymerase sigma-70 factor (ECF subfamily)